MQRAVAAKPMSPKKLAAIVRMSIKDDKFNKAILKFEAELKKNAAKEAELRLRWRKEHELVYVKQYTVKAHMRKLTKKRPAAKPGKLVRLLLPAAPN